MKDSTATTDARVAGKKALSRQPFDVSFVGVLGCFFLSGFAALLYQTAWMRLFSIAFGTSELAVATVLATYMAGLAIGAAIIGRFVTTLRRPMLVYGLLEFGIATSAMAVPFGLSVARQILVAMVGGGSRILPMRAAQCRRSFFSQLRLSSLFCQRA